MRAVLLDLVSKPVLGGVVPARGWNCAAAERQPWADPDGARMEQDSRHACVHADQSHAQAFMELNAQVPVQGSPTVPNLF